MPYDSLKPNCFPKLLVKQLKLVAQIFTNALARKHAEAELRESEARLSLATDAAGVGLWIMEIATGHCLGHTQNPGAGSFCPGCRA